MVICLVLLALLTGGAFLFLLRVNSDLKTKLLATETQLKDYCAKIDNQVVTDGQNIKLLLKRTSPKELTDEQKEFKEKLELKWQTAMDALTEELSASLKQDAGALKKQVDKYKNDFDGKVKAAYDKACDAINFHTVEYKKTITKKRKEFSRKNKALKKQQEHRSIDDE